MRPWASSTTCVGAVLDAVHETTRRWVLLARPSSMPSSAKARCPSSSSAVARVEIIARWPDGWCSSPAPTHDLRTAADRRRRRHHALAARRPPLFPLSLGDQDDHDHDERASRDVPATHRRYAATARERTMAETGSTPHRRLALTGPASLRPADTACRPPRCPRARWQGCATNRRRQAHGHGPRLHNHRGSRSAEQHGKPRHQHASPTCPARAPA